MHALLSPLTTAGAKPAHLAHLTRAWLTGAPLTDRPRLPLPRPAAALLPSLHSTLDSLARVTSEHPAPSGATRLVLTLSDGRRIETVLLPRQALCVSTQVGCAVGCRFCMTGTLGLERNLTPLEILAQVALARRRGPVRRVVFMGMGEPSHNLRSVLSALHTLALHGDLRRKELIVSTVGDPRTFDALAARPLRPGLALSLHSTDAERRASLLPHAPRIPPLELLRAALDYADLAGCPLLVQWTLLAGINDGDDELARLVPALRGRRAIVDFIPYNPVAAFDHARTSPARTHELTRALHAAGIVAKRRESAGQDVDAACGQLRARTT